MKLKNTIIDTEYNESFLWENEYTDWINCMEYDYSETDNVPGKLAITNKVSLKYNTEDYSPFNTVNS
jgi:hypothetical protein